MYPTLILYILEVLACSAVFVLVYHQMVSGTTHFSWMRFFLVSNLVLPILLPLLSYFGPYLSSEQIAGSLGTAGEVFRLNTSQWLYQLPEVSVQNASGSVAGFSMFAMLMFVVYTIGVLYRAALFILHLLSIRNMIKRGQVERQAEYRLVKMDEDMPPFSFLNYLFLGTSCHQLSEEEFEQIRLHELTHIRQGHSVDLLLLEIIDIFFWFNPTHVYIRKRLQDVHEYLADEVVSRSGKRQKTYAQLLLRMVTNKPAVALSTAFSSKQIGRRIEMLHRKRSGKLQLLRFTVILPLTASLLFLFSCLEEVPENYASAPPLNSTDEVSLAETGALKIGRIDWEGNQVYTDDELNEVLGLKRGDAFSKEILDSRLNYSPDKTTISDLYMDNGYLFFHIEVEEISRSEGIVNFRMKIFEGEQVKLGSIVMKGNRQVASAEILRQLDLNSGDLFSRKKLIDAQRKIAEMGYFDPENVGVNPLPDPEKGTVDLEFVVQETTN